eukprot:1155687-Pelagomonas_calceolata.AAC.3
MEIPLCAARAANPTGCIAVCASVAAASAAAAAAAALLLPLVAQALLPSSLGQPPQSLGVQISKATLRSKTHGHAAEVEDGCLAPRAGFAHSRVRQCIGAE